MTKDLDKKTLTRLYVREQKTLYGIAKIFGCSTGKVYSRCKKYGINLRLSRASQLKGLNKEVLKKLYITERKPTTQIAKMFSCSPGTIWNRCRQYGIKLRPSSVKKITITKSALQKVYVKERIPVKEVEKRFSCSHTTIFQRCMQYGIPFRNKKVEGISHEILQKLYVKERKTIREIANISGCSREVVRKRCKKFDIPLRNPGSVIRDIDEQVLKRLYAKENKTIKEIARIFDCATYTISQRVKQFGLKNL